jgi:putative phosphoesterase
MLVGVISDTHDQIENIIQVVELLNERRVELVVHCGDWVSPFTLQFYKGLMCPIKGVFGNNDGDKFRHLKRIAKGELNLELEDRFLDFEIDGKRIAVFHGDYQVMVEALEKCGDFDAVFHGHDHQAKIENRGKTLSLNPGTLMKMTDYEIKGASFAIYNTADNSAELIRI